MPKKKVSKYDKLRYKRVSAWKGLSKKEIDKIFKYAEGYKVYLDEGKTERESVTYSIKLAKKFGFTDKLSKKTEKLILSNKGKAVAIIYKGKKSILDGFKLVAAHVDAPRLDLKANPLYEDEDLALLKTHYYGGIKKYQWVNRPLAMHGVIFLRGGKKLEISIGEDISDPVFVISDLLPHLANKVQGTKKISEAITGEKLNIITGSIPVSDEEKDAIKLNVLKILNEKYGLEEEDFLSSEIELVPASKARDVGFDRGLVGAYGHDDRICSYTAITSVFDLKSKPEYTAIALLVDKEEIGSEGNTSAQSRWLIEILGDLVKLEGKEPTEYRTSKLLAKSHCLSADVAAGINPDYKEVHEKRNAPRMGYGITLVKFTGSRGKGGSSDAHAEFVSYVREIFNKAKVKWHVGELGKVDEGGGGTIAKYISNLGVETIDCGTPVLGMHSPLELASKVDLYETYKGYSAFFKAK